MVPKRACEFHVTSILVALVLRRELTMLSYDLLTLLNLMYTLVVTLGLVVKIGRLFYTTV